MQTAQPVLIPIEKGVYTKKVGRHADLYVYKRIRYYRTETGQPRSDSICIGKACPDDPMMMIPNEKYYTMCNTHHPAAASKWAEADWDTRSLRYGFSFVLFHLAEDCGLLDVLASRLGRETAQDLIAIAAYRLEKDDPLDAMEDWQEYAYLPYDAEPFTLSRLTAIIQVLSSSETCQAILEAWIAKNQTSDCVCWELSSVDNRTAEDGYPGRWDRQRPSGYLMLFSSLSTGRPLFYVPSVSSIQDPSVLSRALEDASRAGLDHFHLFADSRCFSAQCFAACRQSAKSFTVLLPMEHKTAKAYVDAVLPDILDYQNRVLNWHVYCKEVPGTVYQTKGRILVIYDHAAANHLNCWLDEEILRLSETLEGSNQIPKGRAYRQYFKMQTREDGSGIDYEIDREKVGALMRYHGFTVVFTTNQTLTSKQILDLYPARDLPEYQFFEAAPLLPKKQDKMQGQDPAAGDRLISFLTALLASELQRPLQPFLNANGFSLQKAIGKLSNIRLSCGERGARLMFPLDQEQQAILGELGQTGRLLQSIEAWNRRHT